MFEHLRPLPPDPILGLLDAFRQDTNPHKIDLGVGVYKDDAGATPIMRSVSEAEKRILANEVTKTYVGPLGDPEFNGHIQSLLFGTDHPAVRDKRVVTVQTTGGCGALRIAAEFLKRCKPETRIWVSAPTWANHVPLLGDSGLTIEEYPYYDLTTHELDFDGMIRCLRTIPAGDAVLLHGCCHNPCGADLNEEQWRVVADVAVERGFTPFVDMAYQGLGTGIDADAFGLRHLAARVPEMLIASSCSKNFGLYRDRTGSVNLLVSEPHQLAIVTSQIASVIRGIYSMPPHHGAAIVKTILGDPLLLADWQSELTSMRDRINQLRTLLVGKLQTQGLNQDFSFIGREKGMFSFLGLHPEQVHLIRSDHSVYMVDSSRINVAGISHSNIDYLTNAIASVLSQDS